MIIQSTKGQILFENPAKTMRQTLESAALSLTPLKNASLRHVRSRRASLDGLIAPQADFWGADFTGADLAGADLKGADLRLCQFKETCLAGADLRGCDLSGAYFGGAILEGAMFEGAVFSCPSLFTCDLTLTPGINGAVYRHKGEQEVILQDIPIIVSSRLGRLVFIDSYVLYAGELILLDLAECNQSIAAQQ